jgi:peptide chain release factor 1
MWAKLDDAAQRYAELENQLADPAIAADGVKYNKLARELAVLAKQVKPYQEFQQLARQIAETEEGLKTESDEEMRAIMAEELAQLRARHDKLRDKLEDMLLMDPSEDFDSLIMEIRAGVGGDEAALFAADLYRMYMKYAEDQGWKVETLDVSGSDMGGFKEVSMSVQGEGVFRKLRFESGGHRVQRVPKTETQGRIHTSAATVAVLPEPTEVQIDIRPDDVETQTFSCGGPGGQHVNKTQSGVRLIHKPTGVVAESRSERSQHKNKDICWRMLRTRIYEAMAEKERAARAAERKSQVGSGDRSERIRTYNFPQNRLTDHRINLNLYQLDKILAGDLDGVINSLIEFDKKERLGQLTKSA